MTTRTTLRTTIRTELNDSGGTPLWADALLNEFINQAIRSYGRELPKQASTSLTVVAGTAAYNLPADFDRAIRVKQPDDTIRVFDPLDRGDTDELGSSQSSGATSRTRGSWGYRIWASQIVLNPIPTSAGSTQNITLDYDARYAEPAADGDTIATPASDDDVLQALVCANALRWIGSDEAKRQRFQQSRGASPTGMAQAYQTRALQAIAVRKRRLRISGLQVIG
jgi:hypothetical protein